jgi:hypothetical protein
MYAAGRFGIAPRENEIPLMLTTKNFPPTLHKPLFLPCDFQFPLTPALQFSNVKWSIGLKGLTIPTRLKNMDGSFKIQVSDQGVVTTIPLVDDCYLTKESIVDFLNLQMSYSSYSPNIVFGWSGNFVTCKVISPPGSTNFAVGFTENLNSVLGFDIDTIINGSSKGILARASRLLDPYADFKLINVKCGSADPLSTTQTPSGMEIHPETSLGVVQLVSNSGIDDQGVVPVLSDESACSLFTASIPMESVVFYPLSSQNLYSVKLKLVSLSDQLVHVDASLPVVFYVILRKSDYSFI